MNHGSLFSGIGGFDLAAEWMGWNNIFHCEWNPFGQKVLKHYWPKAISYENICTTDFTVHRGQIDVISGGFPCQPFSTAGSRKGIEDSRYLWPEMLRVIREVRPRWIVGENVYGLVNWNGGLVFDTVCADLENEGFKVIPVVLPAESVNAPHRRLRIWFIANSGNTGLQRSKFNGAFDTQKEKIWEQSPGPTAQFYPITNWKDFSTVSPFCDGDDGFSAQLDGITFSKWRNESIKAGGNAIVPQVALQIFKTIEQYERKYHSEQHKKDT